MFFFSLKNFILPKWFRTSFLSAYWPNFDSFQEKQSFMLTSISHELLKILIEF